MVQQQQASATIYQFPVGGRAGVRVIQDRRPPASEVATPPRSAQIAGEAWYHAEAIEMAQLSKLT